MLIPTSRIVLGFGLLVVALAGCAPGSGAVEADCGDSACASTDLSLRCDEHASNPIRCERVPPTVAIASPLDRAVVSGTVLVRGTAADNIAVARVEVRVDQEAFMVAAGTTSWALEVDLSRLAAGPHLLEARATDKAGNKSSAFVDLEVQVAAGDAGVDGGPGPGGSTDAGGGGGGGGGGTGGSGGGAGGGAGGPNSPEPMWHADADSDVDSGGNTRFWKKEVASGDLSRLAIVDDPKGLYGKVYRAFLTPAEISAGSKRAEFSQALLGDGSTKLKLAVPSTPKGSTEEIWFGWRSLFGKDIVVSSSHSNDGNYMQLKGDSSCGGPAIGMTIKYGRLTLRSEQYLPQYNDIAWNGPALSTLLDAWHSFVLHVKFSKDASVGYLEVWLDGAPQTLINGQKRLYFQTVCTNDTYIYPKLGTYGMDSATGGGPYHWFESPRIGTTYDAVVPR